MANNALRKKAMKLRQKGKTYTEIQKELGIVIPKSTLSYWLKAIILSDEYKKRIENHNTELLFRARIKAVEAKRNIRQKYIESLKQRNTPIIGKVTDITIQKMLLSILYLGEGAKHQGTKYLGLGSANEKIIRLYLTLLKNSFHITNEKFRIRIQCRYDQNTREIESFWQNVTGIPRKQFYPTYRDMRTKGKSTINKQYKGICTVIYFNTEIQLELEMLASQIINYVIMKN